MERKTLKRTLFIPGVVIGIFGFAMVMVRIFDMVTGRMHLFGIIPFAFIMIIGLVLMSISMLMHSKDIRYTKEGISIILKILAIFWLVTGGLNVIGMTMMLIFTT